MDQSGGSGFAGARALELVHGGGTDRAILSELQGGARTIDELSLALPTISHEVLDEHLKRLAREGWLAESGDAGENPEASGRGEEAVEQLPPEAGARVFATLADELRKDILLALGRSTCGAGQLQADLGVADATLRKTLRKLLHEGLIAASEGHPNSGKGDGPFVLTPTGRGVTAVAFMLARAEWAATGGPAPPRGHSLKEYLQLLVPGAVLPRNLNARCRVVERYHAAPSQTLSLKLMEGAITVEDGPGTGRPDVRVSGLVTEWDGAIARGEEGGLLVSGDTALFRVVLLALHEAGVGAGPTSPAATPLTTNAQPLE
jgi:DNA-binding HxlR family transcriptional regulator